MYARVSKEFYWIRRHVCDLSANPPAYFDCNGPDPTAAPITPACPASDEVELQISITLDGYAQETSWSLIDTCTASTLASGGGYSQNGQVVSESLCVSTTTGELDFTINDEFGDGICCSYGQGSYTLTLDGVVIVSGGAFGRSETNSISSSGGCVSEAPTVAPSFSPSVFPSLAPSKAPVETCLVSGSGCRSFDCCSDECCSGNCIVQGSRPGGRCT